MYFDAEDGTKLYVDEEGRDDRPVLLFVHGLFCNFTFWRSNVPELAKLFHVISIDMRGHGFSLKRDVGDAPLQVAKDIHALLVARDLRNVTLIGWSEGAHVVHHYVATFGNDRLKSVGFIDMSPKMICDDNWAFGLHLGPDVPMTQAVFDSVRAGLQNDDFNTRQGLIPLLFAVDRTEPAAVPAQRIVRNNSIIARIVSAKCRPRYPLPADTNEFFSRNFTLPTTAAALSHWDGLGAADFRAQVADFPRQLSVLLMYGAKSALFPVSPGQWIFDNLPGGVRKKLKLFDESGHAPHWEEPSKFNRVVARFVL